MPIPDLLRLLLNALYEWRFQTQNQSPEKYKVHWLGLKKNTQTDRILSKIEKTPLPYVTSHWKYARPHKYVKLDNPQFKVEVKEELKRGYRNITKNKRDIERKM